VRPQVPGPWLDGGNEVAHGGALSHNDHMISEGDHVPRAMGVPSDWGSGCTAPCNGCVPRRDPVGYDHIQSRYQWVLGGFLV